MIVKKSAATPKRITEVLSEPIAEKSCLASDAPETSETIDKMMRMTGNIVESLRFFIESEYMKFFRALQFKVKFKDIVLIKI